MMLDEIYWLGINPQIPSLDPPLAAVVKGIEHILNVLVNI